MTSLPPDPRIGPNGRHSATRDARGEGPSAPVLVAGRAGAGTGDGLPEADACYRALGSRDPRFDGLFFVGVTSTGIYCRPVCPAPLPAENRCRFFQTAAAAEAAGFRPCLRCRPERAPGRAIVDASRELAGRAAARIAAGVLDRQSVEALAAELHVGARQLRRVLRREYGATAVQLAQTRRLLLAKRLLTDTDLPVAQVALSSGFSSLRRFNALFRERYRMTPGRLRRAGRSAAPASAATVTLSLEYRPPLAWDRMMDFLAARATAGIESVVADRYARTVQLDGHRGWIAAAPAGEGKPVLEVEVASSLLPVLGPLLARVRSLFDLDAEPRMVAEHLARDPLLAPRVGRRPGLRVPGGVDGFELAWRTVLGQQVSVRAARTLSGRFAEAFARAAEGLPYGLSRYPVEAEGVVAAGPAAVAAIGIPRARAETIVRLARALAEKEIRLEPGVDVAETMGRLRRLPGIGHWSAQYMALRALNWPDAFPEGDLGIRRALGGLTPARARARAEVWRPWRAYATLHLWEEPGEGARPPIPTRTGGEEMP